MSKKVKVEFDGNKYSLDLMGDQFSILWDWIGSSLGAGKKKTTRSKPTKRRKKAGKKAGKKKAAKKRAKRRSSAAIAAEKKKKDQMTAARKAAKVSARGRLSKDDKKKVNAALKKLRGMKKNASGAISSGG